MKFLKILFTGLVIGAIGLIPVVGPAFAGAALVGVVIVCIVRRRQLAALALIALVLCVSCAGDMPTEVDPPGLPGAEAPALVVFAPDADEGSTSQITATVTGGTYDDISFDYEVVSGGGSVDADGLYTAGQVDADTEVVYQVTAVVTGDGTTAAEGTSAEVSQTGTLTVLNVLPDAVAPTMTVSAPDVLEGGTSQVSTSATGGTYDEIDYDFAIVSGPATVDTYGLITAGQVDYDALVIFEVTGMVSGEGTEAAEGTSDEVTVTGSLTVKDDVLQIEVTWLEVHVDRDERYNRLTLYATGLSDSEGLETDELGCLEGTDICWPGDGVNQKVKIGIGEFIFWPLEYRERPVVIDGVRVDDGWEGISSETWIYIELTKAQECELIADAPGADHELVQEYCG